jgi:bis(5'-nucleosidyl)-tetraphosphatase
MRTVKSCGVLVFRYAPDLEFLLMKHFDRFDLPKGHSIEGETELECALRELQEETGIEAQHIRLDTSFRYETTYTTAYKRFGGEEVEKTLVVFMGYVGPDIDVIAREHGACEWVAWNPPHQIQAETINPLLSAIEKVLI